MHKTHPFHSQHETKQDVKSRKAIPSSTCCLQTSELQVYPLLLSTKQKSHTAAASSTCYSHQSHISGWVAHQFDSQHKLKRLHKPISNISCSVENVIKTHITSRQCTDTGQYWSLFEEHYKHKVYVWRKSNSHKCNYTTISKKYQITKERVITSPVHSLKICKQQTFARHMQLWHVHNKTDARLMELSKYACS